MTSRQLAKGARPWDADVLRHADKLIPRTLHVSGKLVSNYMPRTNKNADSLFLHYQPTQDSFLTDHKKYLKALDKKLREYAKMPDFYSREFLYGKLSPHNYLAMLLVNSRWKADEPVSMDEVVAAASFIYDSLSIPFVAVDEVAYLLSHARVEFFDSINQGTIVLYQPGSSAPQPKPVVQGWGAVHWWSDIALSNAAQQPRKRALCFDFLLEDRSRPSGMRVDWLLWLWFGIYLISDCTKAHPGDSDGTMNWIFYQSGVQHPDVQAETMRRILALSELDFFEVKRFVYAGVFDPEIIKMAIAEGVDIDMAAALMSGAYQAAR